MRTPEYERLLDMLTEHPEFSALKDNPCDEEIIAYGSKLWKKWAAEEELSATDPTGVASPEELLASPYLSDKTRDIVHMLQAGISSVEIKAKHGLTAQQLAKIKHKFQVNKTGVRSVSTRKYAFDADKLLKDLERTNSIAGLAKEYGMPKRSLIAYVKRHKIPWKRKNKSDLLSLQDIAAAQRKAETRVATAQALGVSDYTLGCALKHLGVTWQEVQSYAA